MYAIGTLINNTINYLCAKTINIVYIWHTNNWKWDWITRYISVFSKPVPLKEI